MINSSINQVLLISYLDSIATGAMLSRGNYPKIAFFPVSAWLEHTNSIVHTHIIHSWISHYFPFCSSGFTIILPGTFACWAMFITFAAWMIRLLSSIGCHSPWTRSLVLTSIERRGFSTSIKSQWLSHQSPSTSSGFVIILLVGGLEHFLFSHILRIIIPTD